MGDVRDGVLVALWFMGGETHIEIPVVFEGGLLWALTDVVIFRFIRCFFCPCLSRFSARS